MNSRPEPADVRYGADVDVDTARGLYESGLSLVKVGERLGVSPGTILNLFQRVGVATREVGTNQWTAPAARHR